MAVRALIRTIASTFADAITMKPKTSPIDVARAREQHEAYARALSLAGAEIVRLLGDDRFPDGCFVEDCAVVAGRTLITRPGAESRRGEVDAVRAALNAELETHAPATLDGGDCMVVGDRIYVGLTARTNEGGLARVREVFPRHEVIAVPLSDVLHLKCVCSAIAPDTILLAEGALPRDLFAGLRVLDVPREEADAANAVAIGRTLVFAAGAPLSERRVREAGFETIAVDTSEIRKADGALTCLSVLH